MNNRINTKNVIIVSFITLLSAILFYTLILTPVLGSANNGDFGRMFNFIGISDLGATYAEQYDGYFHLIYKIANPGFLLPWAPNWVMGCWISKIAFILNCIFNCLNFGYFDIRFLGAIYALIFLSGIYFILKYDKFSNFTRIILGVFITLFFTDSIYLSYFNSFFGEGTTICCFFLFIGSFLNLISKKEPTNRDFIFLFVSSLCFLTSKTQQLPLLLFMLIIYFALYKLYKNNKKIIIKGTLIVTAICVLTYISIGSYTNRNNLYQSVFTGILYDSDTPEEDLEELGLDPKYAVLAGSGFYDEGLEYDPLGDEMLEEFYPNVSIGKVLAFYIKHPSRAWEKICASAEHAYTFFSLNSSNFVKDASYENKLINTFRYNLIETFPNLHRNIFIFIGLSFIYLVSIGIYFFKSKKRETKLLTLLLLFILASGASQLVLPVLGSGQADFDKHLFLISLSYDILIGTILAYFSQLISKLCKYIRKK